MTSALLFGKGDCRIYSQALCKRIHEETGLNGFCSMVAAVWIQQIYFWIESGQGTVVDGKRWIYNSYMQWCREQFPVISIYVMGRIRKVLVETGLIETQQLHAKKWNQSYSYTLCLDKIHDFVHGEESPKVLKNSNADEMGDRIPNPSGIEDANGAASSIHKENNRDEQQRKENIEEADSIFSENTEIQQTVIEIEPAPNQRSRFLYEDSHKKADRSKGITLSLDNSITPPVTNVPRLDEKVNLVEENINKLHPEVSASSEKPLLKKDMAENRRKGDRHFNNGNQQSEIRDKAKAYSVVGMSDFKDVEDLRECQRQLTLYFSHSLTPDEAAQKTSWIIKAEKNGERSSFVQDYLDGLPIGSWCKKEWQIEGGAIAPVFLAYLRCKLRRDGDTHAQSLSRVSWLLKDATMVNASWVECKRLIDIEKPRLIEAVKRRRDLATTDIPAWVIESFREEIPLTEIVGTAEALGEIATAYNERTKQVQEKLIADTQIPILEDSSPVKKILSKLNILDSKASLEAEEKQKRVDVDEVMDKVAEDSEVLDNLLQPIPQPEKGVKELSQRQEIESLLLDPITRARGVMLAKQNGLSLLLSDEGVAIGISAIQSEDGTVDQKTIASEEGHGAAHQIYVAPKVEKGSLSALKEAMAKSKFFNRGEN